MELLTGFIIVVGDHVYIHVLLLIFPYIMNIGHSFELTLWISLVSILQFEAGW